MARKKISQLESAVDVTASDLIQIVDVEDGVMAPSGTNKKATAQLLANELGKLTNVTATGSTTARSLANRFADVVNVKDFGAVGNGIADDTTAINAATATGSMVYFPAGTYIFSNTSGLTSIHWYGDGPMLTRILWKSNSASSNLLGLTGAAKVNISGINFDGNRQNQTDSTGYYGTFGGSIANNSIVRFDDCWFTNGRITDIVLVGPTNSGQIATVEINNCRFEDGLVGDSTRAAQAISLSEGIDLKANWNVFIQPATPLEYGRGGIVMQRLSNSTSASWGRVICSNNEFENFGRGTLNALGCIYVYSGSELTTITGNIFRNASGTAITVKSDCGNTTVTGNSVYGMVNSTSYGAFSFFQQADTLTSSIGRDLVVSGNTIQGAENNSIFIDGARNGFSDLVNAIVANNICDGGVRGVTVRNLNNARIINNLVTDTTGIGIFVDDEITGGVIINGNTILGGIVGVDINASATTADIEIAYNHVDGLSDDAIRIRQTCQSFFIDSNRIGICASAFTTAGATQISTIRNNVVSGCSVTWDKSGSYGTLDYSKNITNVSAPFTGVRQVIIASGVITIYADWHWVDTEGSASTDDLDTINGGHEGRRLVLYAANNGRDVVLKDGTGNLRLAGDFTLTHADDSIELVFRSNVWVEISRSDNTA